MKLKKNVEDMIKSINKNRSGILLMTISALSLSIGQIVWKKLLIPNISTDIITFSHTVSLLIPLFLGFSLYGIGAFFMIYALKKGELSVLQPMNSLSYLFSIIFSVFFLNEILSLSSIIGICIIIVGIFFIGGSSK